MPRRDGEPLARKVVGGRERRVRPGPRGFGSPHCVHRVEYCSMTIPSPQRVFALEVVSALRAAGFEALWAGGCVRDLLLDTIPKDYDVATSAEPEQVRKVFGRGRTLAIGASFGVITVLGTRQQGQIEVATFRRDAEYSDGRHPDSVSYSTAREDASRRDFTINGLFYDPIAEQVIDYVGGQADLQAKIVRAIGNPNDRFSEDKLRLLRAVRFSATLDFSLEPATKSAIQRQAAGLQIVSAERIAAELRRMLVHPNRRVAMELLQETELLPTILPEWDDAASVETTWQVLAALQEPTVSACLATLFWPDGTADAIQQVCRRLTFSNEERVGAVWIHQHLPIVLDAHQRPWPEVQRVLIAPRIRELMTVASAVVSIAGRDPAGLTFSRDKLALPPEQLNPAPLLTGDDLNSAGLPPGPKYKHVLSAVRDAQLLEQITCTEEAFALAKEIWFRS